MSDNRFIDEEEAVNFLSKNWKAKSVRMIGNYPYRMVFEVTFSGNPHVVKVVVRKGEAGKLTYSIRYTD